MARQTNRQSAPNRSGTNPQRKRPPQAAPKQSQPAKRRPREQQESAPGEVMWRLALILCTGLIVVALLFASVNGGSQYVGLTDSDKDTDTTPTPPVATIDPNLNVEGSDMTPIPPSASPEGDAATGEDQPVTP